MKELSSSFIIDLGDVSMSEKLHLRIEALELRYQIIRSFWDDIGGAIPFYMVLGNHDGETGWNEKIDLKTNSEQFRRTCLPTIEENFDGLSDMIYSYTWGDALFIILNPYTAATEKSKEFTLREQQYEWLEET